MKNKIFLTMPVLVPVFIFYAFNVLTPFWYDDFIMSCFFTEWHVPHTSLLSSFSDVIISTRNIYQTWHGRVVADFLSFLFMFFKEKNIFNVCNTIVYCFFIYLVGFHVTGSLRKVSPLLFMFINILFWLVLPAWGQNFLWLTGSCNYLWTSTIILLFLVPFHKKIDTPSYKPHIVISFLWIVPGIMAGWSMENSASGVFILLLLYFILKFRNHESFSGFEIFGTIGFLLGFFLLLHARNNLFPTFLILLKNIFMVGFLFICYDGFLVGVIVLFGIELIYFRKERIAKTTYGFFLAALGSVAVMIIPGRFGDRSDFITQVFLIITLLSLTLQIKQFIPGRYTKAAGIALILSFMLSFYLGTNAIVTGFLYNQARDRYILSEKQNGNFAIKVKTPIPVSDSHSGMHGIDILDNPDRRQYLAHNSAKATWYGIKSLDGTPTYRINSLIPTIKKYLKRRMAEKISINEFYIILYEDW